MYLREWSIAAALLALFAGAGSAQDMPGLGAAIDAGDLARLDLVVMPDGEGLPDGSGDARVGAEVYRRHCLACHGESGTGGINDELVGGRGTLTTGNPKKTVGSYWPYATTVFDYVRRAMPYTAPGTLSDNDTYAVTAYLLYLDDIIDEDAIVDQHSLRAVTMPNRDGFVPVETGGRCTGTLRDETVPSQQGLATSARE